MICIVKICNVYIIYIQCAYIIYFPFFIKFTSHIWQLFVKCRLLWVVLEIFWGRGQYWHTHTHIYIHIYLGTCSTLLINAVYFGILITDIILYILIIAHLRYIHIWMYNINTSQIHCCRFCTVLFRLFFVLFLIFSSDLFLFVSPFFFQIWILKGAVKKNKWIKKKVIIN